VRVPTCSSLSSALHEPLEGTASLVNRWVLLEDPGPWGYDALTQNRVPEALMSEVKAWGDRVRARVVLVRRGARRAGRKRRIFVASSARDRRWIRSMTTDDLGALSELGRDSFEDGDLFPGEPIDSLYLVCTHGRHDRCCSVRGNPVARSLCAEYGDAAWECSHIGGDRFAANVVCLPDGAYFGRVDGHRATELIESYESGTLDLECFRGWSSLPFAVQAGEIATRRNLGLDKIDDIRPVTWSKPKDTEVAIRMATKLYGDLDVTVTLDRSEEEYFLTCKAEERGRPPLFVTSS
jgi:hypothetical protein